MHTATRRQNKKARTPPRSRTGTPARGSRFLFSIKARIDFGVINFFKVRDVPRDLGQRFFLPLLVLGHRVLDRFDFRQAVAEVVELVVNAHDSDKHKRNEERRDCRHGPIKAHPKTGLSLLACHGFLFSAVPFCVVATCRLYFFFSPLFPLLPPPAG